MNKRDEPSIAEIIGYLVVLALLVSPTLFLESILNFIGDLLNFILIILIIVAILIAVLYFIDNSQNYGLMNIFRRNTDTISKLIIAGVVLILPLGIGWLLSNFGVIALETLGMTNAREFIDIITLSPLYFLTTYGVIAFIAIMIYRSE